MTTMTETDGSTVQPETGRALGKGVDWLVTALLVLAGFALGLSGLVLNVLTDRAEIARLVADGQIQSTVLSDPELVDATYALAWWGGLGLTVTGGLLILAGAVFFVYRRRARRRQEERGVAGPDTTTNAIVGAAVTVVLSFVPLSPVLGGIVAGYLQEGERMDGARAGGLSGLVAAVPVALLLVFVIGGLLAVAAEIGASGAIGIAVVAVVFSLLVAVLYLIALSALGGYVGVYLSEREREREDAPSAA